MANTRLFNTILATIILVTMILGSAATATAPIIRGIDVKDAESGAGNLFVKTVVVPLSAAPEYRETIRSRILSIMQKPFRVPVDVRAKALRFDKDNDFISDDLLLNLTTGKVNNSTITVHILFNVMPPADLLQRAQLRRTLSSIVNALRQQIPEIKIKGVWSNALVGFAIEIPANVTLLTLIKDLMSKVDLNGDGLGDLAIIEPARKMRAFNYYSSIQLGVRPYVWVDLGVNGSGVTVSVIDTGVDGAGDPRGLHTAFYSPTTNRIVLWDDITGDPSGTVRTTPYDDNMHGTHCAGTILGYYSSKDSQGRFVWTFGYSDLSISNTGNLSFVNPLLTYYVNATGEIRVDFIWNGSGTISSIYLLYGGKTVWYRRSNYIEVARIQTPTQATYYNLTYTVNSSDQFGFYGVGFEVTSTGTFSFVYIIHVPVWEETRSGIPYMSGMAPGANLAAWKGLNYYGSGSTTDLANALDWAAGNASVYNITVSSNSWGSSTADTTIDTAVANAYNSGVVVVVAAGNDGAGTGAAAAGSPAGAAEALTIAATDFTNNITEYSSDGGASHTDASVIKPDVAAPGGGYALLIFSADTHWHDDLNNARSLGFFYVEDIDYYDQWPNDSIGIMGTSMATPHVAGIAALVSSVIKQAYGWNFTSAQYPRLVKNVIMMSAYETYPLKREPNNVSYSPTLDKGGKDIHEGYGMVDAYAAVYGAKELAQGPFLPGTVIKAKFRPGVLSTGDFNNNGYTFPLEMYGLNVLLIPVYLPNRTITLPNGTNFTATYKFKIYLNTTNNTNADYDLYLYNFTGDKYGQPVILANSTAGFGANESIAYTPSVDGETIWVAVKRAREDSVGGWVTLATGPSIEEYGQPYGGTEPNETGQAWIGWPIKINGTTTKDVTRVVLEIWASNGTKLATLDSATGDVTIVDPVYYNYYEATWMIPFDDNLVGQTLTVVGYYYDSTGTLTEGPVAVSNIVVNAAPAPIPEPTILPIMLATLVIALMLAYAMMSKRNGF